MSETLTMYVCTNEPSDFPGWYVARPQHTNRHGQTWGEIACVSKRVSYLFGHFQDMGLYFMTRDKSDDPCIIGVWP